MLFGRVVGGRCQAHTVRLFGRVVGGLCQAHTVRLFGRVVGGRCQAHTVSHYVPGSVHQLHVQTTFHV
jgi:cytoskeletal protein CcmA (bactofilin family)